MGLLSESLYLYLPLDLECAHSSNEVNDVIKMADVPMPSFQKFWKDKRTQIKSEY
jgi:hypothetical protein